MTNQRDTSLSSSSFGVNARIVCVDSRLSKGLSSFFTSRAAGAGAVATTTCCSEVSLLADVLKVDWRCFGADAFGGEATDCVNTGDGLTAEWACLACGADCLTAT